MNYGRRSWTASIVGFALAVLAVCAALHLAADLLRPALPVLLPGAAIALLCLAIWRYVRRPHNW